MSPLKQGILLVALLISLAACTPTSSKEAVPPHEQEAEPTLVPELTPEPEPVGDTAQEQESTAVDAVSPCDLGEDQLGQAVFVAGEIARIDDSQTDGHYADLEAPGCHVGVWVNTPIWDGWSADQQALFAPGNQVAVGGTLVSFDGNLIVDVTGPPQIVEAPEEEPVEQAVPEFPAAPESAQLDVPIVYSGLNNWPGMCYLGAYAMLVIYDHPELDFADVVAYSGVGSNALLIDFPGIPRMLTNRYTDQGIINASRNLDAASVLGYQQDGSGTDVNHPAGPLSFEDNAAGVAQFEDGSEALDLLKRAVAAGRPVLVYLNLYHVHDDFAAASTYWRDVLGKDIASHYMTVTGYDEDTIYLNDPTDPTENAANLPASTENFMRAWEDTLDIPGAPPLGPYWMLFITEPGSVPPAEDVVAWNVETAVDAPTEIRAFAENPDSSDMACFMTYEMARARMAFADYLDRNGWPEAAEDYRQSGEMLARIAEQRSLTDAELEQIADLEESALTRLSGGE